MTLGLTLAGIAIAWVAVSGGFTLPNLLLGAVIGAVAVLLFRDRIARPPGLTKLRRIGALAGLFIWELFASAIRVALLVVRPNMMSRLRPAIVAFPLTARSDAEITLLANLITLTPGTLSVDVSPNRRLLYVHALDCPDRDALVKGIAAGFEKRVIEVFQ